MSSPKAQPVQNRPGRNANLRPFFLVTLFGAAGGVASWVFQSVLKTLDGGWQGGAGGILAYAFMGAFAAPFGVYLLANSDTVRQIERTLAFAALCGLFWEPVFLSAKNLIGDKSATRTANVLGDQAADAIKKIEGAADEGTKQKLAEEAQNAIAPIADAASKAPGASSIALTNIAAQSLEANKPEIALKAIDSLAAAPIQDKEVLTKTADHLEEVAAKAQRQGDTRFVERVRAAQGTLRARAIQQK